MSEIAAIAALLEGLGDFAEVHPHGLAVPKTTPAALVELAAEEDVEPVELGGAAAVLRTVSVALVVKVATAGNGEAARNQAAALAKAARAALRADPTLSGACLDSRLEPTEYDYRKVSGQDYAVALMGLKAWVEE